MGHLFNGELDEVLSESVTAFSSLRDPEITSSINVQIQRDSAVKLSFGVFVCK